MVETERLLAMLPGVLSASIEGDIDRVTEVRLLVAEDPPVSEILEAVRAALNEDTDKFPLGVFFRVLVVSGGDASPHPPSATLENGPIRLIAHKVRDVSPGVIGVELTLGLSGHRFDGGASGLATSPGRNRVSALATLSALGSYIRFASEGVGPTRALESVSEFSMGVSRVAVVVVTMSGHEAPLVASSPLTGESEQAVVRATLEATARRVTRLSQREDGPPREATEQAEPAGVAGPLGNPASAGNPGSAGKIREQAEALLESAGPIASAHIVLDDEEGFRIHVLATTEVSRSEVCGMVTTLLAEGLGLNVRSDQITVAQSRLSGAELDFLLGRTSPGTSAKASTDVAPSLQGTSADASSEVVSRLVLADLHIVAKAEGEQAVGVRIAGGGDSFEGRCQASGGGVALVRPLAEATLDAVLGLTQRGGREAGLVLKDVRRFKTPHGDGVVVLVEAMVDGRETLRSGVAFSADSLERASVAAVLQATNAFVAGLAEIQHGGEEKLEAEAVPPGPSVSRASRPRRPRTGPAAPADPQPGPPAAPPAAPPADPSLERPSDSPRASAPNDYVSQVLSRMQSSGRLDRAPPP